MKIRILRTGEEKHTENNLGDTLVSAGLAVNITPKSKADELRAQPRPHSTAQFRVLIHPVSGVIALQRRQLQAEGYFFGPSALAKQNFKDCPDEIIEQYRIAREQNPRGASEIIELGFNQPRDWRP